MNQTITIEKTTINPKMSILDIISTYRQTEAIFKKYDHKAGVCLCCQALFDPLEDIVNQYGLDIEEIMSDLEEVIKKGS